MWPMPATLDASSVVTGRYVLGKKFPLFEIKMYVTPKAVEMSFDHKPEDEPERERINKAGGKVTMDGRVNGGLNLSRALGE